MRHSGPTDAENRIVPLPFHAPVRGTDVFANSCGAPPAMSIRLSLPVAVKPIERLSADQNGSLAPSVPAIGCASVLFNARNQSRCGPLPDATKTMYRPSGESANSRGAVVDGLLISTRISGGSGIGF